MSKGLLTELAISELKPVAGDPEGVGSCCPVLQGWGLGSQEPAFLELNLAKPTIKDSAST